MIRLLRPGKYCWIRKNSGTLITILNFITVFIELQSIVWEIRDKSNTQIVDYELENLKNLYAPFWEHTQNIRKNPDWLNITGEHGWLKSSPQALLEWYNPI